MLAASNGHACVREQSFLGTQPHPDIHILLDVNNIKVMELKPDGAGTLEPIGLGGRDSAVTGRHLEQT